MRKVFLLVVALVFVTSLSAADATVRIFITSSDSWSVGGGGLFGSGGGGGKVSGGARPQTVEIMKTFSERCPLVTVTIIRSNADYIIFLEHEGGKGFVRKDNKVAVFEKEGDMLYAASTRSLGNAVKDACRVITEDLGRGSD